MDFPIKTIEIVDFPMENHGDFLSSSQTVSHYQSGIQWSGGDHDPSANGISLVDTYKIHYSMYNLSHLGMNIYFDIRHM